MEDLINLTQLGTDINSDWIFKDGDLVLVSDKENLRQAVTNRLNTLLDSMDDYYYSYGSALSRFFGWRKNEITLKFMRLEIENCLKQDPRLQNFDLDLFYGEKGVVNIHITTTIGEDEVFDMNMVLSDDGSVNIVEEDVESGY